MGILNLILAIWVYNDAKNFRRRGVPVKPGVIASIVVFVSYLATLFFGFGGGLSYYLLPYSARRTLFGGGLFGLGALLGVGLPFVIYLLVRSLSYSRVAELGNPPLPPAPRWSFWLFIVVLVLPLLVLGGIALFFLYDPYGFGF